MKSWKWKQFERDFSTEPNMLNRQGYEASDNNSDFKGKQNIYKQLVKQLSNNV